MAKATNFRPYGDAVLSRLGAVPADLRAAVQAHIDAFAKAHAAYEGLCDRADSGREARDNALAAVGTADKALDAAVLRLADALSLGGTDAEASSKYDPQCPPLTIGPPWLRQPLAKSVPGLRMVVVNLYQRRDRVRG